MFGPNIQCPKAVGMSNITYQRPAANFGAKSIRDICKSHNLEMEPTPLETRQLVAPIAIPNKGLHQKDVVVPKREKGCRCWRMKANIILNQEFSKMTPPTRGDIGNSRREQTAGG